MINFKQFITEIANPPPGYTIPGNRTKFALGDIALVIISTAGMTYQSKRSAKYQGKAGVVVGYKAGSQTVQYAVEFPDGKVEAYISHFLYGPFKDIRTAEKYDKNSIDNINPKDLKGHNPNTVIQKSDKLEELIKKVFTSDPFNFNWLEQPIVISDGNNIITILATLPRSTFSIFFKGVYFENVDPTNLKPGTELFTKYRELAKDNILIYRLNNAKSLKLKSINNTYPFLNIGGSSVASPYALTFFHFTGININDKNTTLKEGLLYAINNQLSFHNIGLNNNSIKEILNNSKKYIDFTNAYNKNWTDEEVINFVHDVGVNGQEKTITLDKKYAYVELILTKEIAPAFKEYNITDGRVKYVISSDNENIILPKKIFGEISFLSDNIFKTERTPDKRYNISDFSFLNNVALEKGRLGRRTGGVEFNNFNIPKVVNFPQEFNLPLSFRDCNLTSLYGLPKILESLNVSGNLLKTLDGDVEEIQDYIIFDRNPIRSIGSTFPIAKHYSGPLSEEDIQKAIKLKEMKKIVSPDTAETFGDFMSEL